MIGFHNLIVFISLDIMVVSQAVSQYIINTCICTTV